METPKEYYYTYYSYEEWGRGYFGSRKCYCLPEEDVKYLGSSKDKTFKPKYKIILKDDYATREEAYADEIILQEYYKVVENPHFANKAYQTSTKFYVSKEKAIENGNKTYKRGVGIWGLSLEERIEMSRKVGNKTYELGIGVHGLSKEQKSINGKKGAKRAEELGVGIYGLTKEQMTENGKKGGKIGGKIGGVRTRELGVGIHKIPKKERMDIVAKTNSQRWECCETGYVSTAAGVVRYQKGKGIDTSKNNRLRIS
jgi:hypothetical protein